MTFLRITQLMNAEAEPEAGALGKSDSSSNDTLSSPQPSLFLPLACTLPWQLFNLLHNTSNGLDSNWFTKLIFHEVRKKKIHKPNQNNPFYNWSCGERSEEPSLVKGWLRCCPASRCWRAHHPHRQSLAGISARDGRPAKTEYKSNLPIQRIPGLGSKLQLSWDYHRESPPGSLDIWHLPRPIQNLKPRQRKWILSDQRSW